MSINPGCEQIRELVPEVALGTVSGEERALVLQHVASCAGCRRYLDELSRVADGLLVIAPSAEPPAGFETRVLEALDRARVTRKPRIPRLFAAAVAGALLVGVGGFFATRSDRRLADDYEAALAGANGQYFGVAPVHDSSGERMGHVFAYEGTPSWMVVVLNGRWDDHEVEITTEDGRQISLGTFQATASEPAWGTAIPVAVHDVEIVSVGSTMRARLSHR